MKPFELCPGAKAIKTPYPEEIKCLCGQTIEIWSDEVSTICQNCQRKVTREMPPSCLDWCLLAKECIGEEKYKRYLEFAP